MKTLLKALGIVAMMTVGNSASANADLLLFSDDNTFHGCLDCNKYESESVCNKYGTFGSKYSSVSIWNKYGLGSKYDDNSPFSKYGNGLKVVDTKGNFYGTLSISYSGDQKMQEFLKSIWDITDGDYDKMRDIFCDNF